MNADERLYKLGGAGDASCVTYSYALILAISASDISKLA